ncbi:DUF4105 domain-containing protein [Daeguia caeni]|uniref:DUF4105 domain-containing protein n=1 Tax=Daeguia caeni TaxID=439612 RepID=A0ABV9H5Z8_9HYPH
MLYSDRLRPIRILLKVLFSIFLVGFAIWGSLAMWYQLPFGKATTLSIIVGWLALSIYTIIGMIRKGCWKRLGLYGLLALALLGWWSTIRPSLDRLWAPELAHTVTGTIDGNLVTLHNVRDFKWTTASQATPQWKDETYDLDTITSVDVFLSYWTGPAIAHTLLSFGFADGRHVVFSGEIRREHHEVYSPVSGFFRQYELALIAAEEEDVIFLRTNMRKEDVYRYRVKLPPQAAKELFLAYVNMANQLAHKPEFYNTLTTNCTTIIFHMARLLDKTFPFDYRILLSGYLPGYLYDHGWLENGATLDEVRKKAFINARAQAGGREGFSRRIRE